jgi:hypothetical protein
MHEVFEKLVSMIVPYIAFVFGLVEFLKSVSGLQGKAVTLMSFVVGVLVGGAIYVAYMFPDWGVYVAGGLFILASGLVASGFYKFANDRLGK